MGTALLIARLLLVPVFAVAGVAKLADRGGSRGVLEDFGVPVPFAAPLGILLPLAELAVAVALIPSATAWWGALGALVLLLLFVAGISFNLARGHKPDCRCFGQIHSAPVGWKTLLRNGVLATIAGFVVWQGYDGAGPSVVGWVGTLSIVQLVGLVAGVIVLALLVAQWWFLLHLMRQNGRLLVRLERWRERSPRAASRLPETAWRSTPRWGCRSAQRPRTSICPSSTAGRSRSTPCELPASP